MNVRELILDGVEEKKDENILTLSFASQAPYRRKSKDGRVYDEVLLCTTEAINFTRLIDNRCPLLLDHDTEKQIGVVERAYIKDEKLYCDVKFSDGGFSQQIMKDVKAGIRRNTSIGYDIDEFRWEEGPTLVAVRWTPLECSIVPIPADPLVGYQRSLDTKEEEEEMVSTEDEKKGCSEEEEAKKTEAAEENKECSEAEEKKECDDASTEEKKECNDEDEIRSLGDIVGKKALAEEFISNKRSLSEFKEEIRKINNPNVKEEKKMEKFSLRKALLNAAGKLSDEDAKFEREVIAENKRKYGINDADIVLTREQLRAFDGTEAPNQVVYQPGLFANVLRAPVTKDFVGTRKVNVTDGKSISFATATSGINAGYVDLNGDVPSATMDFALKQMLPHKAGAYVDVSYQSLMQDDPSAEAIILEDIGKALAQVQDNAFFNGLSGNNQPVGLLNTTGVNEVTLPDTPALSTALAFEKKIRESNDYSGDLKWVFGTEAYYKWAATPYSATEQNKMLLDDETRKCIGYDTFIDHNIPTSSVILGNFGEAIEADFDGLTIKIVTEDKTLARKQAIEIIAYAANDYCFRRPKSFTKGV